jgi:heat shock protein HslJ
MGGFRKYWPARLAVVAVVCAAAWSAVADEMSIDLKGSEWGFKDEAGQRERYVQFGGEGLLSGTGGCNRFAGGYEQAGDAITVTGLISTLMACAPDAMQRERELVQALEAAHRIEATHAALKVYGEDGALLLDLIRRDWD